MGAGALLVIDKQVAGEGWSNTWGLARGAPPYNLEPADADFIAWGAAETLTDASTANAAAPFTTILQSILNFERRIHDAEVQFTRVYITDAKKNFAGDPPAEVPNAFFTATINFPGIAALGSANLVYSGLVTFLVGVNPSTFSHRRGRKFFRMCLTEGELKAEASGLIDWQSDTLRSAALLRISQAVTGSSLDTHFAGAANVAGGLLVIPHFSRYVPAIGTNPPSGGEWLDGVPVGSVVGLRPVGRQVKRGRKRPALG